MTEELSQVSFYLAKPGNTFDSVISKESLPRSEKRGYVVRDFTVDRAKVRFHCLQARSGDQEVSWINFVNEQLTTESRIPFLASSQRPSGLLLIMTKERVLAAAFGMKGEAFLDKSKFHHDFGIVTAMNMCDSKEVRQTKTRSRSYKTQNISRQMSLPSETLEFGLRENEFLHFISAHLPNKKNVTVQGKDKLTFKATGDEKLDWKKLIRLSRLFLTEYKKKDYKSLYSNYPNFEPVDGELSERLDLQLIKLLKGKKWDRMHMAIPEFISDDEFGYSYSNYPKKQNDIVGNIDIAHVADPGVIDLKSINVEKLKRKFVYAYSYAQELILNWKRWPLYNCLVAEISEGDDYFILSDGIWQRVPGDFYSRVEKFVDDLNIQPFPKKYSNLSIAMEVKGEIQNREEVFNEKYVDLNDNSIKFDKAKLRIGQSAKDKEFCDILEYVHGKPIRIIQVKKYGSSGGMAYLVAQTLLYCEFFLSDKVFLSEIRTYIEKSGRQTRQKLLNKISENLEEVTGNDYEVCLWLLYDVDGKKPTLKSMPLMAKFELKLAWERLRLIYKYSDVKVCFVPVKHG